MRAVPSSLALLLVVALPAGSAAQNPDSGLAPAFPDVVRMEDADASCEQLYAEAGSLAGRIAASPPPPDPMEAAQEMQAEIREARQSMIAAHRARSVASSLLGLVPGAGTVAGSALAAAAGAPGTDTVHDAVGRQLQLQRKIMAALMEQARLRARREHLTTLFLQRGCKVTTLDSEALEQAASPLRAGGMAASSTTPPPELWDMAPRATRALRPVRHPDPGNATPALVLAC